MCRFSRLSEDDNATAHIADVLPWVHEAGNPYYDWFLGGPEAARKHLDTWMMRRSSEIAIARVTLLFEQGETRGGFIGLSGSELTKCRQADTLAVFKVTPRNVRDELTARIRLALDLFDRVDPGEFYLSKIWVPKAFRLKGKGHRLIEAFMAAGRAAGYHRFRLDVAAENTPAIKLYEDAGFEIARECASAGLSYVAMVQGH